MALEGHEVCFSCVAKTPLYIVNETQSQTVKQLQKKLLTVQLPSYRWLGMSRRIQVVSPGEVVSEGQTSKNLLKSSGEELKLILYCD